MKFKILRRWQRLHQRLMKINSILLSVCSLSIQNEVRKFKQMDEKLIKKFLRRLLLNLCVHLTDVNLTLIIDDTSI